MSLDILEETELSENLELSEEHDFAYLLQAETELFNIDISENLDFNAIEADYMLRDHGIDMSFSINILSHELTSDLLDLLNESEFIIEEENDYSTVIDSRAGVDPSFIESRIESDIVFESESESEFESDPESEFESDPESEFDSYLGSDSEPEPEFDSYLDSDSEPEPEFDSYLDSDSDSEDDIVVEPEIAEPEIAEPEIAEPEIAEPEIAEPEIAEPEIAEPEIVEPEMVEPEIAEPEIAEPEIAEPEMVEPKMVEPEMVEPEIAEPEIAEPEIAEPEIAEPEMVEPEIAEPKMVEPEIAEPEIAEPEIAEPKMVEPEIAEPEMVEPEIAEPKMVEPEMVEPEEASVYDPADFPQEEPSIEEFSQEEPSVYDPADFPQEEPFIEEFSQEEPSIEEFSQEEPSVENITQEEVYTEDFHEIIPKLIFIVPYRDREQQLTFFRNHMKMVLEDMNQHDYKIIYIHQKDTRSFNRGAMKNIGFLYVKQQYPDSYKSITLVFNDIDTMPFIKNFLNYETTHGNVKHFYGYKFTLGGIVSIRAGDFELTNGFPNYWSWGYEDNAFQDRVLKSRLNIDRTKFYPILDKNILQFNDSLERVMNRKEFDRFWDEHRYNKINDGYQTISELQYFVEDEFLNITNFKTAVDEKPEFNQVHNLKNGSTPFRVSGRRGGMSMVLR
jgi:hypothetical protein